MDYSFLVASDVDYTLLMPGKPVSNANKEAIKAVREAGGAFTLATGRTSFLTGAYILDLGLDVPLITSNGAAIYDPIKREEVYSSLIPEDTVREFMKCFFKNNTNATGYAPEAIYFAPGSSRRDFIINYNKTAPKGFEAPIGEMTEDMIDGPVPKFNKFLLVDPDKDSLQFAYSVKDLEIVMSAPGFYDIMYKGATKGDGILRIADMLGIPRDKTFALGDSDNDLSMLVDSKYGIAMGNANDVIKQNAAYISTDCESDGFAKALLEYVIPKAKSLG